MSHTRSINGKIQTQEPSFFEKVMGTIPATIIQMTTLHPFDTATKRLSKNKMPIRNAVDLNKAIFLDQFKESFTNRYTSLYAGFGVGMQYKMLQTLYKFSFQPCVNNFLKANETEKYLSQHLSKNLVNPALNFISGGIIGALEVAICLPIDSAKIKKQNNPELKDKSLRYLIGTEVKQSGLTGAYKGSFITLARNIPGSAFLFFCPELVCESFFHSNLQNASKYQAIFANAVGSAASLVFSNPQDVIKIRLQSDFKLSSAMSIAKDIIRNEGYKGFSKGLGLKFITQIPKLTVVKTLSDVFAQKVQNFGLFSQETRALPSKQDKVENQENSSRHKM